MKIKVAHTANLDIRGVTAWLEQLEGVTIEPLEEDVKPDAMDQSDYRVLWFYSEPFNTVAKEITEDTSPSDAIHHWSKSARTAISAKTRNPDTVTLVSIDQIRESTEGFESVLVKKVGMNSANLHASAQGYQEPNYESEAESSVYTALAAAAVMSSPSTLEVWDQLTVTADLPLAPGNGFSVKLDGFCEKVRNDIRDIEQGLKSTEEENDLVIEQLHYVQEEYERLLISSKEKEKKLEKSLKTYKNKYLAITNSTSWKITMPMRVLKRALTGKPVMGKARRNKLNKKTA